MKKIEETNHWNPESYNKHTHFVSALAMPAVALLDPKEGEDILDVGCGEGTLAVEIAQSGARVVGVDMSVKMVAMACKRGVDAYVRSVTTLDDTKKYDKVFSNATLHWVKEARVAVQNMAKVLKKEGVFVAEFGAKGNVAHIVNAIETSFAKHPEFGAFIDIGLKNDGMIHILEMSEKRIKHPLEVLSVNQYLARVEVISIDLEKNKVGLSLK